ncbi:MAG: GNAT family N-acetyltransferase [Candidatus Bipolaricaulota bacterium]|nr:GNAT family N-acetyltransferase [Candidatus Bipolaricaulota bacterium]
MRIVDLSPEHESVFASCLEDRLPEAREAGSLRAEWIHVMKGRGLRAKLAVTDREVPVGMIQYVPASETLLDGSPGAYFVYCIWVVGFRDDRGNHQGKGLGTALLAAAEADAKSLGATGLAAWGLVLPFWMRASWFRKHGYRRVDRSGMAALMWKPFAPDTSAPRFVRPKKTPKRIPGQITVTSFLYGQCRAGNVGHERARRACAEIGSPVVYRVVDTKNMATANEWGILDALYVDDREVRNGPPLSYDKLKKRIEKAARRLR